VVVVVIGATVVVLVVVGPLVVLVVVVRRFPLSVSEHIIQEVDCADELGTIPKLSTRLNSYIGAGCTV
jgi:hypothetical protein